MESLSHKQLRIQAVFFIVLDPKRKFVDSDDESNAVTEEPTLNKECQELIDNEEIREFWLWKQIKDCLKWNHNFSRQQKTANKVSKPKNGFGE